MIVQDVKLETSIHAIKHKTDPHEKISAIKLTDSYYAVF